MNRNITLILIFLIGFISSVFGQVNPNHTYVSGYTRSDGTVVKPYYRTAPNSTNIDNFSTVGNTNPYTGKAGWIPRDDNYAYGYLSSKSTSTRNKSVKTYRKTEKIKNYGSQKQWIKNKLYLYAKKSLKKDKSYNKSLRSETKKQRRVAKKNKTLTVKNRSDGWYNINFARTVEINKKTENLLLERQILIENGKITKYIGSENMVYDVYDFRKNGSGYDVKIIFPDNTVSKVYFKVFLYQEEPLKNTPEFDYPSVVFFYVTESNNGGEISLVLESKNKVYWGGFMDEYWNEFPDCQTTKNVIKFYLPKGNYTFYAENNKSLWSNSLMVDKYCQGMRLTYK